MTTTISVYKAEFEFLDAGGKVRSITLLYTADTIREAVFAPIRFWDGRHKAMPEYFVELGYVQVMPFTIGPVAADGGSRTYNGMRLFEWSQDRAGMDLPTFAEYLAQKLEKL